MGDIYDIKKYTDQELYSILDINNPTDRELEARIIQLIKKYEMMQTPGGDEIATFFKNVFDHFFTDEKNIIEGFDTTDTTNTQPTTTNTQPTTTNTQPTTTNTQPTTAADVNTNVQSVQQFDYTPDKLQLNPILKQTIKRIISIDSRYRDINTYPSSTNFTFDLSEPLKDVVSLKLYSIQIPYTWYTISNAYGSNFIYIKGISSGINDGTNDLKIEIPPGNYTSNELITAVNKNFYYVSNNNPDINFGSSDLLTYNSTNSKVTVNLDIQKMYNETQYSLQFPYWTPSINSSGIVDLSGSRTASMPSYFGFNYDNYTPYSVRSNQSYKTTNFVNNDNKQYYLLDNSNNYFTVINYTGPNVYNPQLSTILNTITVPIYDTIKNTLLPANNYFSNTEIVTLINNAIVNSGFFNTSSSIQKIDISNNMNSSIGNVQNAGNSYYKLDLILDRNVIKYIPNSKLAVIFPSEQPDIIYTNTVWLIKLGANSCLYFDNTDNELNEFVSETYELQSNYKISTSTNILFECTFPEQYKSTIDFSSNDFKITIPGSSNYSLTQLFSIMNTQILNTTSDNQYIFTNSQTNINLDNNSKFNFIVDLTKTFSTNKYAIYIDNTTSNSILNTSNIIISDISTNPVDLSGNNQKAGTIPNISSGYIFDSSYIFTIVPSTTNLFGNKNDISYNICLLETPINNQWSYNSYVDVVNAIQNAFNKFTVNTTSINDLQKPLSKSSITINSTSLSTINFSLNIQVNYSLTESNYKVTFKDANFTTTNPLSSWYQFSINYSYILYNNTLNLTTNTQNPYATITGAAPIASNSINILNGYNTILLKPTNYYNGSISDIPINITANTYTNIIELLAEINRQFTNNPLTNGSTISNIDIQGRTYVKIRLNINKIYTSSDYQLVFYDTNSFMKLFINTQNLQNTTWDSTLGWILGFHYYTNYPLFQSNQTTNINYVYKYFKQSIYSPYTFTQTTNGNGVLTNTKITLEGDTTLTTILYNYFLISLDDYIQNHLNDGLVTITRSQQNIPTPGYVNASIRTQDPSTGQLISSAVQQPNSNNLTTSQLESLNQSISSQNNVIQQYSPGPFIKDLFGLVPIKTGTNGTYYIEFGGSLQNQERLYFGPVNIRKMSIQLMTDRGDTLDLNGSNWSFSFICEQLYRNSMNT